MVCDADEVFYGYEGNIFYSNIPMADLQSSTWHLDVLLVLAASSTPTEILFEQLFVIHPARSYA